MSYKTQVLAINVGLNDREEISLNLLVEPEYLLNPQPASSVAEENEVMLIEGKLLVSF